MKASALVTGTESKWLAGEIRALGERASCRQSCVLGTRSTKRNQNLAGVVSLAWVVRVLEQKQGGSKLASCLVQCIVRRKPRDFSKILLWTPIPSLYRNASMPVDFL